MEKEKKNLGIKKNPGKGKGKTGKEKGGGRKKIGKIQKEERNEERGFGKAAAPGFPKNPKILEFSPFPQALEFQKNPIQVHSPKIPREFLG